MNEDLLKRVLGNMIREKRKLAGYSQTELADKSNISKNYISNIERGEKQPTVGTLFNIAQALDKTPSSIMHEIELRLSIR